MGDRVAVMNKGVLQQVAQPQQLYDRPANLFVAAFIGTPPMNLLEGTVTGENGSLRLALGPDSLALDARASTAYPERVLLGYDLLYLTRGAPVVYYGDEVGMIGTGGDQQAGRTCSRRGSRSGRQSPASAVRGSARAPRST